MMEQKTRRLLLLLLGIGGLQAAALVFYRSVEKGRGQRRSEPFRSEKIDPPMIAPRVSFENIEGSALDLASFIDRPILLHFWATWCLPCRVELPSLLAQFERGETAAKPLLMLVSLDENWNVIRHYFGDAVPTEVVRDVTRAAEREFHVETLPETLFLRPGGKAVARIRGARDWHKDDARAAIEELARSEK